MPSEDLLQNLSNSEISFCDVFPSSRLSLSIASSHSWNRDILVLIAGRTKTDGPQDYDAVHKIQAGYKITPLSQWGKAPEQVPFKIDPTVDMKTPPKEQVEAMSVGAYFAYAAEVMKLQPHLTDEPIVAQMKRIGIERGKSFDINMRLSYHPKNSKRPGPNFKSEFPTELRPLAGEFAPQRCSLRSSRSFAFTASLPAGARPLCIFQII
jgi:hypothetical protein